jgi:hypothetical protein
MVNLLQLENNKFKIQSMTVCALMTLKLIPVFHGSSKKTKYIKPKKEN